MTRQKQNRADPPTIGSRLGHNISQARIHAMLTQEQVAERLGIGNEAISRIERGVVIPTIPRLFELADLFNCRIETLLNDASDRIQDQSEVLTDLLDQLDPADRKLVLDVIRQLVKRLKPD